MNNAYTEEEKIEIANRYENLLKVFKHKNDPERIKLVKKAFDLSVEAHQHMRRKSGEPYIYHPIEVAEIVARDIGLGTTSVVSALLHDVVEDTEYSLEDIESLFGKTVSQIIDGLTKISGVLEHSTPSIQAENFRKILLTLSDDIRVILIKLADRLHNMRTLGAMSKDKRLKIASETAFLYSPLAHRLGLYTIKSELDDLSLKYREPEIYDMIEQKIEKSKEVRSRFIQQFSHPLKKKLDELGIKYTLKARQKSIASIWNKMTTKSIPFEEVYDIFALRIILHSTIQTEKSDCWWVYSIISDIYKPNPDRLRDWISTPRANGYESLHTTLMSPTGKWVEVQIRSERMDEIAERGFAAHWKYKENSTKEAGFENWISKIREILDNPEPDAIDFIGDFKLNLFAEEIFVFTPQGDLKTLPIKATALDFAYDVHTRIGNECIAAKVNQKLVPLSYELKSGDQVEIITSKKQKPHPDWVNYVTTGRAKTRIKQALKENSKLIAAEGKEILERKFNNMDIACSSENFETASHFFEVSSQQEMFYRIAKENIDPAKLKELEVKNHLLILPKKEARKQLEKIVTNIRGGKTDMLVIGENMEQIDYKLAPCCNPIPGDDVFGFTTINDGIKIHRTNCPNAIQLMANYAYRIIKAKWTNDQLLAFLAAVRIEAIDKAGLLNKVTDAISNKSSGNLRSIKCDVHDGIFIGNFTVYVHDLEHLNFMLRQLKAIPEVKLVKRVESSS